MRVVLLLALAAVLSGCGLWGTNCGDAYLENMARLEDGDYQVRRIDGTADVLRGVDHLSLALDRERQKLTLTYPDGSQETYAVSAPRKP